MAATPRPIIAGVAFAALGLFGIEPLAARTDNNEPFKFPDAQYEPVAWPTIERWASDDHAAAFATFLISCRAVALRKPISKPDTLLYNALIGVCRQAVKAGPLNSVRAREFFEQNFRPVRIKKIGDDAGFLTGYYEPIVDGSRFPSPEFPAPLYRRPPDLTLAGRKPGGSIPNKGKIVRVVDKKEVEYHDRGAIEDGALDGKHLEITWLRDHITTFVIQIQGSARVRLEDGTMLRVNYDAHNGHPYTAVGRILMERGYIARHEMSMARIRNWMARNPDEGREVRHKNRSFIFFRITGLGNEDEPSGAQGVPLTPGRSIAVDRLLHSYGTPFFIEADLPLDNDRSNDKFNRLTIAQDTGSAIVGPARADIYFGSGDDPGAVAGRIRNSGRFVMLVPNEIDPVAAGRHMPLPHARPKPPEPKSAKGKGKSKGNDTGKTKNKPDGKADSPPEARKSNGKNRDVSNDGKSGKRSDVDADAIPGGNAAPVASPGSLTSIALIDPDATAPETSESESADITASIDTRAGVDSALPLPRPRPAVEQKSGRRPKARSHKSSHPRAPRELRRYRAIPRPPGAVGAQ